MEVPATQLLLAGQLVRKLTLVYGLSLGTAGSMKLPTLVSWCPGFIADILDIQSLLHFDGEEVLVL